MISHAWYVTCDLCGDPSQISTESARVARKLAKQEGYGRRRVAGKMLDLCGICLPKPTDERDTHAE